ncbi:MAG: hypothetical protein U0270_42235 [Labilithrix sp.]
MRAVLGAAVMTAAAPAHAVPQTIESARSRTEAASPPRAPAPFVLPELAHHSVDFSLDWHLGRFSVDPDYRQGTRSHAYAGLVRAAMEANVVIPRRFFVGWSYPIGFALPPDGGLAPGEAARPSGVRRFTGNAEAHIRTVFPLPTWLEIGFELGVMFPTSVFSRDYRPNISAAREVGALDPTHYVDFLPGRLGFRPAGDLRIRRGPLVFQARHGMDILLDNQGLAKTTVTGRLAGHIGYLTRPDLEVAIEGAQFYFFASADPPTSGTAAERVFTETYRAKDGSRSAIAIGPTLRAMTEFYDYGFAVVTNLADPLSPVSDGFLGVRLSIIGHVEK